MITKRIVNVWRAVLGSRLTNLEVSNAEALLDLEREELRKKIAQLNLGLAGYAAISEKLKAESTRLKREQTDLHLKLKARLDVGDRLHASQHALRLEAIEAQLEKLDAQRVDTEITYKDLVRARELALVSARERIDGLKRDIGDLRVQQSLADVTELAASMHGALGMSDGTLERVQHGVNEQRHLAAGRVRVAREAFDDADLSAREAEQTALAEAALLRFEQRRQAPQPETTAQ